MYLRGLLVLLFSALGMSAHADTFQFSYSGVTYSYPGPAILHDDSFNFQLATSSLNDGTLNPLSGQISYVIPATVNGVLVPDVLLSETNTTSPGIYVDTLYVDYGAANYYYFISYGIYLSGGLNDPTITAGTYNLVGENYEYEAPIDGTLTITDFTPTSAAAPEPSSFALLSTGVLGIACLFRRRFAA